jgi:triosephosphate isomerase
MNMRMETALELAKAVSGNLPAEACEVALCPPSVYLAAVAGQVKGSAVGVGGQNLYAAEDGAYTGEVNAAMLVDVGCQYVILGHSERRQHFAETDAAVSEKCVQALESGLVPIVCVGETLEQREADQTREVVAGQIRGSLSGVPAGEASKLVIAYEPVWAIGTGRTATPEQAEEVHLLIRGLLKEMFDGAAAEAIRLQYGGSVKPANAAELLGQPNIDGALVGGASLKADDFLQIISAAG